MDTFQSDLGCCGANGPADWTGSKYATRDPSIPVSLTVSGDVNNMYKVPESCCKDKESADCKLARNMKVASVISPAIYSEVIMIFFAKRRLVAVESNAISSWLNSGVTAGWTCCTSTSSNEPCTILLAGLRGQADRRIEQPKEHHHRRCRGDRHLGAPRTDIRPDPMLRDRLVRPVQSLNRLSLPCATYRRDRIF